MVSLNKAKRIDLIDLCEECGIHPPEKPTIHVLIKLIKNWEDYDEDFIKDRLEVIVSARKAEEESEEKKLRAEIEEKKLKAESELEEKKLRAEIEEEKLKMEMEERKWRIELQEKDREREFEIKKMQLQEDS